MFVLKKGIELEKNIIVALGVFDGVHKGHQELIERSNLVMTFYPHPQIVTHKDMKKIKRITTLDEKVSVVDRLYVVKFNDEIAKMDPEDFVKKIIVDEVHAQKVVIGYDYMFGKSRGGTPELLKKLGDKYGFDVEVIDKVTVDGVLVKSSLIRSLLKEGDISSVNKYLGRDYLMRGLVVHGRQVGTKIGYPTVNLEFPKEKLIPGLGVYAGYVLLDKKKYIAAINISMRNGHKLVEAFLLDFTGEIYGEKIDLFFCAKIRDEKVFSDLKELSRNIKNDIDKIKKIMA